MRRVATAIAIIALAGCGKGPGFSSRESAKSSSEFTASISINPATLDPALSQDVVTNDLMSMVFEGLVGWGQDNTLEPRLAERWDVSQDGRTYTFHLRKVAFSNGAPVRAQDFKSSWERACDPNTQSPTPDGYLGDILGVEAALKGERKDISGVEAVDDTTLKVTLKAPTTSFLGKLTYPVAAVMPQGTGAIDSANAMIGAGPFKVASYTPEAEIVLAANSHYYNGTPETTKLTYLVVKDASTRINLLKGGKLDWAAVPQADVPAFRSDKNYTLMEADRPGTFYFGMNGTVYPPFADIRVRQAFNRAVDKERIVRDVLNGLGQAAVGYVPPSVPQSSKPLLGSPYDPALAKELVRASGWEGNLPALELWVSDPNGDRKRVAEMATSMLTENLGVPIKLRLVETSVLIQKATRKELGFFMGSWYMDYLDPENLLSVLLSAYGQNRTSYDNPRFTELCRKADSMSLGSDRLDAYREAENIAINDCPWIPLYHPREAIAVRKGVSGLVTNAFGLMPPTKVRRN